MKAGLLYFVLAAFSLLNLPVTLFASGGDTVKFSRKRQAIAPDSFRTELPLKIVYDKHLVTPIIEVFVNDQKIDAIFDSGSFGLRVLNGALKKELTDTTENSVAYSYGDGERNFGIRGRVQSANIRVGNLTSRNSIRFMRIDSTRYGLHAGWTDTGDSAIIKSNHFRSVAAIIGVSMRASKSSKGISNPLAQLPGNGKYIVSFPHFGDTTGQVVLNPDSADLEGFTNFKLEKGKILLPNGDSSWRDNEFNGCVIINGKAACQNTMIDTGSPDIHVLAKGFQGHKSLPAGNQVTLTIKDKAGISQVVQTDFTVSEDRKRGRDFVYLDETNSVEKNIFGTRFFFDFDVLYDQVNGVIGIRKKRQ